MKRTLCLALALAVLSIPSANSAGMDKKRSMMKCYQLYATPIYMKACLVI